MFPDVQIVPGFSIKMFKKVGLSALSQGRRKSTVPRERTSVFCLISVKIDAMIQAFQGRDNGSEGS